MKRIKLYSFLIVFCFINIYSQDTNNFEAMKNAFLMGLDAKGLDIGHIIISNKTNPEREKSLFCIAEYFLSKSFEDSLKSLNRAYTFYSMYETDYKNGEYISIVKDRKNYLESFFSDKIQLVDYLNKYYNEKMIVDRKLNVLESFFHFNPPNPFEFYNNSDNTESGLELIERYCDDIILNNPNFSIIGYYIKAIAYLSQIEGSDIIRNGIFTFKSDKILKPVFPHNSYEVRNKFNELKNKVDGIVKIIDDKFPTHHLTINLHLILSNVFLEKNGDNFDNATLNNLEYVLKNTSKLNFANLLVKEFILKNQFENDGKK